MNNLLTLLVEYEQVSLNSTSKASKIKTSIKKNYNECQILKDELIHLSIVSSGIPYINKVVKAEIERSESLLEDAKNVFT